MNALAEAAPRAPGSDGLQVRLVNAFAEPFNNAVATARSCYASRLITPADVAATAAARTQRDAIARSTYEAGHHTTLQHASYQFALSGVSRQCLWSFLHAHPHYNSEQVSQRYVGVRPDKVYQPTLPAAAAALYRETIERQMAAYTQLVELLTPATAAAYFKIFGARQRRPALYAKDIRKKAQEEARYALPIATTAHLYHTLSGLTLHRYWRACQMLDVPKETRALVQAMVEAAAAHDPLFFRLAADPLPLESTHEFLVLADLPVADVGSSAAEFIADFDRSLGDRRSVLIDYSSQAERTLARSVRTVLGLTADRLSDQAAIARVLSPAHNPYLGETLNLSSLGKLSRTLAHVHYVFAKKLSHAASSQDQRHRSVVGSLPVLRQHYAGGTPDLVLPRRVVEVPEAQDLFMRTMQRTWNAIDQLLDRGVDPQDALYLLPNAFPVRCEQSGDLLGLHHKWTTRLCYNAQEEIFSASLDELIAVREVHPQIAATIRPPCGLRAAAGVRPCCPEGSRFCGVTVWKQQPEAYRRTL
jgi:thymidylate synthase ThyX